MFSLGTRVGEALRRGKLMLPPFPGGDGAPRTGKVSLSTSRGSLFPRYRDSERFSEAGFAAGVMLFIRLGFPLPRIGVFLLTLSGLLWLLGEGGRGRRRVALFVMGGLAAGEGDLEGGEPVGFGEGVRERVSREVDL